MHCSDTTPKNSPTRTRKAIEMMEELRESFGADKDIVISGCVGPRGDGYVPSEKMTPEEAAIYHSEQISTFQETKADMVCAITMNY